jgi:DNA-binding NarL/FixJ family response regulator
LETAVNKIRVLAANQPRLMRELVITTIVDQPDIEVVGETDDETKITELVEHLHPDFLIMGLDESNKGLGLCGFLLGRYPHMRILALAPERNCSICYWAFVDIRSRRIETSEEAILSALRGKSEMAMS